MKCLAELFKGSNDGRANLPYIRQNVEDTINEDKIPSKSYKNKKFSGKDRQK